MSIVSKAVFDPTVAFFASAIAHFESHPSADTAALLESGRKALAGFEAASVDFPALLSELATLSADVARDAADVIAQSPDAIPATLKLLLDLKTAFVAASDALAKAKAGAATA